MTKDLSKQICEKCGIKAQYLYDVYLYDRNFKKWYILSKKLTKQQFLETKFNFKKYHKVRKVHKLSIDFGQPENFVKLLELPLPWYTKTLWDFITHKYCYCQSTRRTFLHDLKEYITNRYHKFPSEEVERIKQTIRKAEWKYE